MSSKLNSRSLKTRRPIVKPMASAGCCISANSLSDEALSCRKRPYAFRIDVDSGPEQPEAVCKDLRDPAYPHPRTGHSAEALQAAVLEGVWHDPRAGPFYWLGTSSTGPELSTTAGAQLRAAILRDGALARAQLTVL